MPALRLLAAVALAVAVGANARADEYAKLDYPQALLERPLILPPKMVRLTVDVGVTDTVGGLAYTLGNYDALLLSSGAVGVNFGFAVDVGIARGWQLGVAFDNTLVPTIFPTLFDVDVQRRLTRALSLRVDLGAQLARFASASTEDDGESDVTPSLIFGIGLPLKLALNRFVALVSGDAAARGMGTPPTVALGGERQDYSGPVSDDLFTLTYASADQLMAGVYLPVGVMVQPHRMVAIGVRSGYRMLFRPEHHDLYPLDSYGSLSQHFVPLDVDIVLSPTRLFDLGFRAQIPGRVAQSGDTMRAALPLSHWRIGWGDIRQFTVWATMHL